MRRRLFEDLVVSRTDGSGSRGAAVPVSVAIHAALLSAVVIVPTLTPGELPTPPTPRVVVAFSGGPTPPPPPPRGNPEPARRTTSVPAPRREEARFVVPDTAAPQPPPDTDPLLSDMGPGEGGCVGCSPNGPDDHGEPYGIGEEVARPASVVRVGVGGVQQPRKIRDVVPRYPDLARLAGVEGTVIIECTIDPQGNVVGAQVLKGHPLLDAAAIDAVQQWRYTPTLLNGVPVSVVMTVTAQFHLRR